MGIIKVERVTINYKVGHRVVKAVDDVNLDIQYGEYFCILGSNGSGKSSLLKAMLGLIPISSGTINLEISKNEISYLPQVNAIPSDFPATVNEIVISGTQKKRNNLPFYKREDYHNLESALSSVELSELRNRKFSELSGGQQQRVLLARALVKNPKLLFLDEPCSGLDESISKHFYSLLKYLNEEQKVTIIMISHDSSHVEKYATNILHLAKKVIFYGNINQWIGDHKRVSCIH
ncbi:MAG: ABC transporter ATP-binding protein [Oscillospiraceae bacterium]|jgi:zinc transport system ATP-binding protein|nr:ABC transporter ATP-binding protein [Oscillospiraceae bacterium]